MAIKNIHRGQSLRERESAGTGPCHYDAGGLQAPFFQLINCNSTLPSNTFSFPRSGTAAESSLNHPVNSPVIPKMPTTDVAPCTSCIRTG